MAEPMKKRPWQGFLLEKPLAAFSPLPVFVSPFLWVGWAGSHKAAHQQPKKEITSADFIQQVGTTTLDSIRHAHSFYAMHVGLASMAMSHVPSTQHQAGKLLTQCPWQGFQHLS